MRKTEDVKLFIDTKMIEGGKNMRGEKGEKCNNCAGYGYTIRLKGGKLPCTHCKMSGVKELTKDEMQKEIYDLKQDIHMLREALMNDLGFHGTRVPKNIKEATHAQ